MKRVVVTGIGVVSCLGNNQEEVYQSLLNSKSGISFSEEYKEYNLKSHVHGKPNINLEDHVDRKFIRFILNVWGLLLFQEQCLVQHRQP